MIEMKVQAVTVDQSGGFLVLLTDKEEKKVLPISIGPFEAQSIASFLQGKVSLRPLTHELFQILCQKLGAGLEKVVVTDIRDSTFYAELHLRHHDQLMVVDSRPSDAIALALRCGADIFMKMRLVEFTYDTDDFIPGNPEDEEEKH